MKQAAENIIAELNKRIPMPRMMHRPRIMTDEKRCEQLLTDVDVDLDELSKQVGIAKDTLIKYRDNPILLRDASYTDVKNWWASILMFSLIEVKLNASDL